MTKVARPLSIALIGTRPTRAWQAGLAAAFRSADHTVALTAAESGEPERNRVLELLLELERRAYRAQSHAFAPANATPDTLPQSSDIIIDLRERPALTADDARLIPVFDGAPGEDALIDVLLDGRAPEIAIVRAGNAPRVVARGLPSLEQGNTLARGLDFVLTRTAELLRQCAVRIARGEAMHGEPLSSNVKRAPGSAASFAAKALAARLSQRLTKLAVYPEHWSIAFRRLHDDAVIQRGAWPNAEWTRVLDDGARYFADPFAFVDNGRTYVFCEEYPYATGKGIISLFEIADGVATQPRPVFERPYHLSYPFVFRRGSHIYMIPEASSVGRIEIYRADPFPDRWVFERVLVDDVVASDATLVNWQGRDWLFASVADAGASTWDALGLFYADDLFGEWTPHPLNPVLIDAGAARPGGAMLVEGDRLRRVAQDCHAMYGGGIVIANVARLDPEDYAQSVRAVLGPPAGLHASGAHTLNVAGEYELIDLVGKKRRL
ncbi:MAG: hypothetical protein JOZ16_05950 [Methylobacteriaceae bacterium]|nr:hypothetical protein [Methylobacteriaceae bacterium]